MPVVVYLLIKGEGLSYGEDFHKDGEKQNISLTVNDPGERVKGADVLSHFDPRYESSSIR